MCQQLNQSVWMSAPLSIIFPNPWRPNPRFFPLSVPGVGHGTKCNKTGEKMMDQTKIQTRASWISSYVLYQLIWSYVTARYKGKKQNYFFFILLWHQIGSKYKEIIKISTKFKKIRGNAAISNMPILFQFSSTGWWTFW